MKVQPGKGKQQDMVSAAPPEQVHKPVTLHENVILTIKVFAIAALVFAALVAIIRFTG